MSLPPPRRLMSTAAEPPPETTPKPWGFLSLQSWEPKSQHPLANGIDAKSTKLCGGDSQNNLIVGRGQGSAVRLHKALNWTSNKHLFIRRDADTGVITAHRQLVKRHVGQCSAGRQRKSEDH